MSQVNESDFKLTLPLEKSSSSDDRWVITGTATGLGADLEGQAMSPEAIEKVARQVSESPIPLLDHHRKDTVIHEMGQVVKAWVNPDFSMGVDIELDKDHPTSQWVWKKLESGKQFGLSVFGKAKEWKNEFDKTVGKSVLTFKDVVLTEISLTTKPIWTPSFGTVLRKAVDESAEKGENTSMSEETPKTEAAPVVPVVETPVVPVANPEPEVQPAQATQPSLPPVASAPENATAGDGVVEKAVSADSKRELSKLTKLVKLNQEMNALIEELGLSGGAVAEGTASEPVAEAAVEKSEKAPTLDEVAIAKALQEITAPLYQQIEELKARVPETGAPSLLVQKSEADQLAEYINSLDPRAKLRFALQAREEKK